jgi:heptosyltransferase-2
MVRAPNWVGDAVMAVPALREIKRIFAGAHVSLVAKPWVAGLFEGEDVCDETVLLEEGRSRTISGFLATARYLKGLSFDLAVLFQNAFGAALLARASHIPLVAGYPTDARRLLLDIVVPARDGGRVHQVDYYLNIAAAVEDRLTGTIKVGFEKPYPRLSLSGDQARAGRQLLLDHGLAADAPVALVNPGATNSRAKMWPADHFAEIADRLAEEDAMQIAIIGTSSDEAAARDTAALMRSRCASLAGRTTIAQLKSLIGCASLVVSNDTGAAHVSAALGIPTVVVFGPTEHFSTRPLSDLAAAVRRDVYCSPCMLRDCPIDHRCMTGVTVADVYEASRRVRGLADSRAVR